MRERQLSPAPSPVPALEEMLVEFSGGRFDGEQMLLLVEVADPMHFRVLGRDYRVRAHTRASEVEGRVVT